MGLFFITPGRIKAPEFMLRPDARSLKSLLIPTTVAVLVGPDGDVTLVDAGFSQAEMEDPLGTLGPLHAAINTIEATMADSAVAQLARREITADRVTTIVATHLHLDHVGAYVDFPNAELVAPAAEFASARERGTLAGYVHTNSILRTGRARPFLFSGDRAHGFPRHHDLFGDGRVVLLDARGHTAGSVAVLLTDADSGRTVLMAGDAAYTGAEYRLARMSRLMKAVGFDHERIRATWGALYDFELNNPEITVVPSHDPEVFEGLRHA